MAERRLVILQHSGKTPVLAMCDSCRLKFFTPRELTHRPAEAEENLQEKFKSPQVQNPRRTNPQGVNKNPFFEF
jgi:hypothetical protein